MAISYVTDIDVAAAIYDNFDPAIFNNCVLSGAARTALKTAISGAPIWNEFRNRIFGGKNTGALTKMQILVAGVALGVYDNTATLDAFLAEIEADTKADVETAAAAKPNAPANMSQASQALENVIDNMRPFIADKAIGNLEAAIADLRTAAESAIDDAEYSAGPVAPAAPGSIPHASPVGKDTAGKMFGLKAKTLAKTEMRLWDAKDAPRVDPDFVFETDTLHDMLVSINRGRTVFLAGPAGTGKTSLPREIAARTGRPFTRIPHSKTTEPQTLIGQRLPEGDCFVWKDGVLTAAIRKPGNIILLDEPTFCRAGILAVYQTLLDHRTLTIEETGEIVRCARGVVFVIADNTSGNGDETGRYADTNVMNAAFLDRSAKIIRVDYLPRNLEIEALIGRTGCTTQLANMLVDFAALTRKSAEQGDVTAGLSFRRMIELTFDLQDGVKAGRAFQNCILNLLPEDDAVAIHELSKAGLDLKALAAAATGKPMPKPVSKAGGDFDAVDPASL